MGNRQFHRSFIILKAWNTGYGLQDGKDPAGYAKLEIKNNQGNLHLYIQDMKPAEVNEAIYDVVLVSSKTEVEPVKLTSIQIPESGRGEYEIGFEPDNIRESGNEIGQYHGLAVVDRHLKGDRNFHFPLIGYSDKDVVLNWEEEVTKRLMTMYGITRNSGRPVVKGQERNPRVEKKTESKVNKVTDEPKQPEEQFGDSSQLFESDDAQAGDVSQLFESDEAQVGDVSQLFESDEANGANGDVSAQIGDSSQLFKSDDAQIGDVSQLFESDEAGGDSSQLSYSQEQPQSDAEASHYSTQNGNPTYWSMVEEYYNRLFDNHRKVTPFDDIAGEVDWVRVENRYEPTYPTYQAYPSYQAYSPYQAYNPYPYYRSTENRLDHYLVGLVRNLGKVQYVVYGVPGIYSVVPPMSLHGFSRWLPVKNGYGAGYWLLYIDAMTGNIAYPY